MSESQNGIEKEIGIQQSKPISTQASSTKPEKEAIDI
jgi:hypothetical protein